MGVYHFWWSQWRVKREDELAVIGLEGFWGGAGGWLRWVGAGDWWKIVLDITIRVIEVYGRK